MRITVVGSADAFNSAGRGHSCYLIDGAGDGPIMVDFGCTALQGLGRLGRRADELDGIVLTHLHGDHFGGFAVLHVALTYQARRRRPLKVVGPPGTRERLLALLDVSYGSAVTSNAMFPIEWTEIAPGEQANLAGSRVLAFAADHQDLPEQPLCLRILGRGGEVAAFSGDTAPCEGLFEVSRGAGILIAECTSMSTSAGRHCTWGDWERFLARPDAHGIFPPRVVFSHLGEDVRRELPGILRLRPQGDRLLEIGEDGMTLEVGRTLASS